MEDTSRSLKSLAINRINSDLIESTLQKSPDSFLIMIVDEYSAKIVSNYMTMTQILNYGIFSVESIFKPRHEFPNYQAIYFISPSDKSIDQIVNDFSSDTNPKYSRIHIYFTHKVPKYLFNKLITKGIINRTLSCKELNLSFYSKDENVFDFGFESGLQIFNCQTNYKDKLLTLMGERLFTICATLNILPIIRYQKNSQLCTKLCEILEELIQNYNKDKKIKRKGLILLTDRTIDPFAPLLHDYNYCNMIYDLFNVKNDIVEIKNKKINLLDEKDDLWKIYKKLHIAQAFNKLTKDFEEFQSSDLIKVGNKENLESFEGMSSAINNISTYKLKTTYFGNHITLAEECNNLFKSNHIGEIIELEQNIILKGNDQKNLKDLFKNAAFLKKKIEEQREDLIRLFIIFYAYVNTTEKDFSVLTGKLNDEETKLFENLQYLNFNKNKKDKKEIGNKYKINNDLTEKLNDSNLNNIKYITELEDIIQQASDFELDKDKFPIKNEELFDISFKKKKKGPIGLSFSKKKEQDEDEDNEQDDNYLILFNIGCLARNEIAAIDKLIRNKMLNHKIVMGSTKIINSHEYVSYLKELSDFNEIAIKKDLLEDSSEIPNFSNNNFSGVAQNAKINI